MRPAIRITFAFALLALLCVAAGAQAPIVRELPPGLHVPPDALPGPGFDVDKATEAWLAVLSPEQRALSDAYFEGGYWLQLWGTLYTVAVLVLLLVSGASRRLADLASRASGHRSISVALYGAAFVVLAWLLSLPFTIYADFYREHQYGLATQSFGPWFSEQLIGLGVATVILAIAISAVYAGIRRAGARWWIWATGMAFVFTLLIDMLYPVLVAPLFNDFRPLPEGQVRDAVLSLAHANGIPAGHVEWFDASRQTTRVSANVAGLAGLARINLNDNLLDRTSLPEIRAVLAHEMGHYVLNHPFKLTVFLTIAYGAAFALTHVLFDRALVRWGPRLGVRGRSDPAGLPLGAAILVLLLYLLTPVTNTIVRSGEAEADAFGLNAAREPQGFASTAMRLSTYRKLRPGPVEEFIFYDHPSGYDRVRRAMIWQKENL